MLPMADSGSFCFHCVNLPHLLICDNVLQIKIRLKPQYFQNPYNTNLVEYLMVTLTKKSKAPTVTDAIFMTNANCELTSFNKAAENLFGLKSENVLDRNFHEIFGNDK
ncbi:MAG: PAS domain S-box protein, partial [Desulfobacterales bacterium]